MRKFLAIICSIVMLLSITVSGLAPAFAAEQPQQHVHTNAAYAQNTANTEQRSVRVTPSQENVQRGPETEVDEPNTEPAFTITQSNAEARPGSQGLLYFTLSADSNVSSFSFLIKYDADFITIDGVEKAVNLKGENFIVNFNTVGEIIVSFVGTENITAETKLFNVTFTLADSVSNGTELTNVMWLDTSFEGLSFTNADAEELPVSAENFKFGIIRAGKMGDIVGTDNVVNVRDLLALQRAIVRLITLTEEQRSAADINGDGKINTVDAQYLKMYLVGKIDSLVIGGVQQELDDVYTVTFMALGKVVEIKTALKGNSVNAPKAPEYQGYTFTGWDSEAYTNVQDNVTINALYSAQEFTVTFVDYDDSEIAEVTVAYGGTAKAPASPTREESDSEYYVFKGWDTDYSNVTDDLVVKAVYETVAKEVGIKYYTVTFKNYDGKIISQQQVKAGGSAIEPSAPIRVGWNFKGWGSEGSMGDDFTKVLYDMTFVAEYTANTLKVEFLDWDSTLLGTSNITYGGTAVAPVNPTREGYVFIGWSAPLDNITSSQAIFAQYKKLDAEAKVVQEKGEYLLVGYQEIGEEEDDYSYSADFVLVLADSNCTLQLTTYRISKKNGEIFGVTTTALQGTYEFTDAGSVALSFIDSGMNVNAEVNLYSDGTFEILNMSQEEIEKEATTELGTYENTASNNYTQYDSATGGYVTIQIYSSAIVTFTAEGVTYSEKEENTVNGELLYTNEVHFNGQYSIEDGCFNVIFDSGESKQFTCYTDGTFEVRSQQVQTIRFRDFYNEEFSSITAIEFVPDTAYQLPTAPLLENATFVGWMYAGDMLPASAETFTYIEGYYDLYAQYEVDDGKEVTFPVTFVDTWTGTETTVLLTKGEAIGSKLPSAPVITSTQYVFKNWAKENGQIVTAETVFDGPSRVESVFEYVYIPTLEALQGTFVNNVEGATMVISADGTTVLTLVQNGNINTYNGVTEIDGAKVSFSYANVEGNKISMSLTCYSADYFNLEWEDDVIVFSRYVEYTGEVKGTYHVYYDKTELLITLGDNATAEVAIIANNSVEVVLAGNYTLTGSYLQITAENLFRQIAVDAEIFNEGGVKLGVVFVQEEEKSIDVTTTTSAAGIYFMTTTEYKTVYDPAGGVIGYDVTTATNQLTLRPDGTFEQGADSEGQVIIKGTFAYDEETGIITLTATEGATWKHNVYCFTDNSGIVCGIAYFKGTIADVIAAADGDPFELTGTISYVNGNYGFMLTGIVDKSFMSLYVYNSKNVNLDLDGLWVQDVVTVKGTRSTYRNIPQLNVVEITYQYSGAALSIMGFETDDFASVGFDTKYVGLLTTIEGTLVSANGYYFINNGVRNIACIFNNGHYIDELVGTEVRLGVMFYSYNPNDNGNAYWQFFLTCVHDDYDQNFICDMCGAVLPHDCVDENKDYHCDLCGYNIYHVHVDNGTRYDGEGGTYVIEGEPDCRCDLCWSIMNENHIDVEGAYDSEGNPIPDYICDRCGLSIEHTHVDEKKIVLVEGVEVEQDGQDGRCELCHAMIPCEGKHYDYVEDYHCDYCGMIIDHTHVDEKKLVWVEGIEVEQDGQDGRCELCNEMIPCEGKHYDYIGKWEGETQVPDYRCDCCDELIEHVHVDNGYKQYNEDGSTSIVGTRDDLCDLCGEQMPICSHEDKDGGQDYICDLCGATLPREVDHQGYIDAERDTLLSIEGIVTGIFCQSKGNSYNGLYLQDEDGGYYVYNLSVDPLTLDIPVQIGMKVRATGEKDIYAGIHEIVGGTVEVIDATLNPVAPEDVTELLATAESAADDAMLSRLGKYVLIRGVQLTGIVSEGRSVFYTFTLGNVSSYVRLSSINCPIDKAQCEAFIAQYNSHIGYTADVVGCVTIYDGSFYLEPVGDNAYFNFALDDGGKLFAENNALSLQEIITEETTISLPTAGSKYDDVAISWAIVGDVPENVAFEGTLLTVTLPQKKSAFTLRATLTIGELNDTKDFIVTVYPASTDATNPVAITEPKEGTFKLVVFQNQLGQTLYFTGSISRNYLDATESLRDAADVTVTAVEGGYTLMVDGKYIEIVARKAALSDASTGVWVWNTEAKVFTFTIGTGEEAKTFYLGTYRTYNTFSASLINYITGSNLANIGVSQFPAYLCTMQVPAPEHTCVDDKGAFNADGVEIGDGLCDICSKQMEEAVEYKSGDIADVIAAADGEAFEISGTISYINGDYGFMLTNIVGSGEIPDDVLSMYAYNKAQLDISNLNAKDVVTIKGTRSTYRSLPQINITEVTYVETTEQLWLMNYDVSDLETLTFDSKLVGKIAEIKGNLTSANSYYFINNGTRNIACIFGNDAFDLSKVIDTEVKLSVMFYSFNPDDGGNAYWQFFLICLHVDNDGDAVCDLCSNKLEEQATCDTFIDTDEDGYCDTCLIAKSQHIHTCVDNDSDSFCDYCGNAMAHTCIDEDGDMLCDICKLAIISDPECKEHVDADENGYCDVCEVCFNHVDDTTIIKEESGVSTSQGADGLCDRCGTQMPCYDVHYDYDGDNLCDYCKQCVDGLHVDGDGDNFCDICNYQMGEQIVCKEFIDSDGDDYCDNCNKYKGDHAHNCYDESGDWHCDLCGEVIAHDCVDSDGDGLCDLCSNYYTAACIHVDEKGIINSDGKEIGDGLCDLCSQPMKEAA